MDQTPSKQGVGAANFAKKQLGEKYVLGGEGPDIWDCSGLTQESYRSVGVFIPRTSEAQWAAPYQKTTWGHWAIGDLIYSNFPGEVSPGHVCMYTGEGMCIEAPHTNDVVKIVPVDEFEPFYVGSNRPAPYVPPAPKVWDIHNGAGLHLTSTKHPVAWFVAHPKCFRKYERVVAERRKA